MVEGYGHTRVLNLSELREAIIERLNSVIVPETGADVFRMRWRDGYEAAAQLTELINKETYP